MNPDTTPSLSPVETRTESPSIENVITVSTIVSLEEALKIAVEKLGLKDYQYQDAARIGPIQKHRLAVRLLEEGMGIKGYDYACGAQLAVRHSTNQVLNGKTQSAQATTRSHPPEGRKHFYDSMM